MACWHDALARGLLIPAFAAQSLWADRDQKQRERSSAMKYRAMAQEQRRKYAAVRRERREEREEALQNVRVLAEGRIEKLTKQIEDQQACPMLLKLYGAEAAADASARSSALAVLQSHCPSKLEGQAVCEQVDGELEATNKEQLENEEDANAARVEVAANDKGNPRTLQETLTGVEPPSPRSHASSMTSKNSHGTAFSGESKGADRKDGDGDRDSGPGRREERSYSSETMGSAGTFEGLASSSDLFMVFVRRGRHELDKKIKNEEVALTNQLAALKKELGELTEERRALEAEKKERLPREEQVTE